MSPTKACRRSGIPETQSAPQDALSDEEPRAADGPTDDNGFVHAPGAVLFGRIELLGQIGDGGWGTVFRAHDRASGRVLAAKLLKRPHSLGSFKQEFRLHRGFSHPHVLSPDELLVSSSLALITMPFLNGARRLDWVLHGLNPGQRSRACARYFKQLASAVAALHGRGILHCDLKPSNTLIDKQDDVRLIDFGASLLLGSRSRASAATAAYVAPEVALGHPASPASDWYSLGVMLWEGLAGRKPFEGTRDLVIEARIGGEAPALRAEGAARNLVELAQALVRRAPEERPRTEEILSVLGASPSPQPESTLVGRAHELSVLQEEFERAACQGSRVLDIRGESGIGKTALVAALCQTITRDAPGALVLNGACSEFEAVPYDVLDEVIEQVALLARDMGVERDRFVGDDVAAACRLFPPLRSVFDAPVQALAGVVPSRLRQRAVAVVAQLVEWIAQSRPVAIVLDQLQWAQSDSAEVLHALLECRRGLEETAFCHDGPRAVSAQ